VPIICVGSDSIENCCSLFVIEADWIKAVLPVLCNRAFVGELISLEGAASRNEGTLFHWYLLKVLPMEENFLRRRRK
jgi:hypothetical protein